MRDLQALQEDVYVGIGADALMADPLLQRMFADVEAAIVTRIVEAETTEETMHFKECRKLLAQVKNTAYKYIETGNVAADLLKKHKAKRLFGLKQ